MTGEPETEERRKRKVQRQLDEALADSFPASDPVSIVTSQEEEDWNADGDDGRGGEKGGAVGGSASGPVGDAAGGPVRGR